MTYGSTAILNVIQFKICCLIINRENYFKCNILVLNLDKKGMTFMAGWGEIVNDIDNRITNLRKEYFNKMFKLTGRNIICYYSAWQQKPGITANFSIDDNDLNGFMSTIKGLVKNKGLDLIIHTPGGEIGATQKIVEYLKSVFNNDIRVFVPHTAMSAGTMIACAAKEIYMGKHSFLGPIDPQIRGVPSKELQNTIANMKNDLSGGKNVEYWKLYMNNMPPQLEGVINNIISHSKAMIKEWLKDNMIKDDKKVEETADYLSDYDIHMNHNNCLNIKKLRDNTSLNIIELESDSNLQDAVLSIYHGYQILVSRTNVAKLIENQNFDAFVVKH